MKLIALLLLALMSVVIAGPIETKKMTDEELADSLDFIHKVQGDNQDMYVIVFTNSKKDYLADVEKAFAGAKDDPKLAELDIYQDDFDNSFKIQYGQIDVRDTENFG